MKVGLFTSLVDSSETGPGVYRENLACAFKNHKFPEVDIKFLHYEDNGSDIYDDGYGVKIPEPLPGVHLGRMKNVFTESYIKNHNFDIIHLQKIPWTRPFWRWDIDAKVVTTIHFAIRPFIHPKHSNKAEQLIELIKNKYLTRFIDGIITVTEESKRLHSEIFDIPLEKLYVTHNAAPRQFDSRQISSADELGVHLPKRYILHISNKNYYKNPEGIIRGYELAVDRFDIEHDLVLAGGRWSEEDFFQYLRRDDLRHRIHFLGYVPRDIMPSIYSLADIFFLPSLSEAFPFVFLESMACGTPIVTIGDYGMEEILGNAGVYIDSPTDHNDIASCLVQGIDDSESLGKIALKRCETFSWEQTARDTLNVYRSILSD